MRKLLILIITISLLQSCVAPRVETIWKAALPLPYKYEKILVIAVLPEGNDSLQRDLEKQMVQQLSDYGYHAVSYVDGYSIYNVSRLTQEAAYFTLCEKGIDAVLTVANVTAASTLQLKKGTRAEYPAAFYYNHIWDYRNSQPTTLRGNKGTRPVWESILFDLRSLEQQAVLQAKKTPAGNKKGATSWIAKNILEKMISEKILFKKSANQPTLKAF